jgi:hypothetical protein
MGKPSIRWRPLGTAGDFPKNFPKCFAERIERAATGLSALPLVVQSRVDSSQGSVLDKPSSPEILRIQGARPAVAKARRECQARLLRDTAASALGGLRVPPQGVAVDRRRMR